MMAIHGFCDDGGGRVRSLMGGGLHLPIDDTRRRRTGSVVTSGATSSADSSSVGTSVGTSRISVEVMTCRVVGYGVLKLVTSGVVAQVCWKVWDATTPSGSGEFTHV